MIMVMYHDDDCGEPLTANGNCPKCQFIPDMQSTGFRPIPDEEVRTQVVQGRTFLGLRREVIQ